MSEERLHAASLEKKNRKTKQGQSSINSDLVYIVEPQNRLTQFSPTFSSRGRLISKRGDIRVLSRDVPNKAKLYFSDLFTTVIDLRWHWVLLFFVFSYIFSWLVFAVIWWAIVQARGIGVCFENVKDWTSAFLFSVETQQTIGYGGRSITTKCPETAITLQIQSLVGIMIDAFLLGLTFAKLSRPRERTKTVLFSENAVITLRDGKMCLVFRVGDVRKSQLVEAHVRLQLFQKTVTLEGHEVPFYQRNLRVCYDWRNYKEDDDRHQLFLLFPQDIIHVIDERSPLYDITPGNLHGMDFELVVVLDAIVEATGLNMQAKTSYLSSEILWGYDFKSMADTSQSDDGEVMFFADFSKMDDTYKTDIPLCSRRVYDQQMHEG